MPEVVYIEPLSSLLGISVNELLAGERIPILALIRKMDETRIELVTQLASRLLRWALQELAAENEKRRQNG